MIIFFSNAMAHGFGFNGNIFETNIINLAAVVGIVISFVGSNLTTLLQDRKETILKNLQEANQRSLEAQEKLTQARTQLEQAKKKADEIREEGLITFGEEINACVNEHELRLARLDEFKQETVGFYQRKSLKQAYDYVISKILSRVRERLSKGLDPTSHIVVNNFYISRFREAKLKKSSRLLLIKKTFLKPSAPLKTSYVSCSCGNNVECMVGMLVNYSRLEIQNWMRQHRSGFLAACWPNYMTQAYYSRKINQKLRDLEHSSDFEHLSDPKYSLNQTVYLGPPKSNRIYARTGDYKPGRYKSILEASQSTGICINYLVYGVASIKDPSFTNWNLIFTTFDNWVDSRREANYRKLEPGDSNKELQKESVSEQITRYSHNYRFALYYLAAPTPVTDIQYGTASLRVYNAPGSIQPLYQPNR